MLLGMLPSQQQRHLRVQQEAAAAAAAAGAVRVGGSPDKAGAAQPGDQDSGGASDQAPGADGRQQMPKHGATQVAAAAAAPAGASGLGEARQRREEQEVLSALLDVGLLSDRNRAFEEFRKSYRHNEVGADAMCSLAYACAYTRMHGSGGHVEFL